MHRERNGEVYAQTPPVSPPVDPRPRCPQLRAALAKRRYPVQGYCVLVQSPGWFMIPSIEEYREYCTTPLWGDCHWFGWIGAGKGIGAGEAHRAARAFRVNTWQPPDCLEGPDVSPWSD